MDETVMPRARELIAAKIRKGGRPARDPNSVVPTLMWASACYAHDERGERIDYGAQFFLHWQDKGEVEADQYVLIAPGVSVALGPAQFFREGSHVIGCADSRLTLE